MLTKTLLAISALVLVFPTAAASSHFDGYIASGYPVGGIPSGVALQLSDNYVVKLHHGDTITASLAWTPWDPHNDLDLVLLLPSAAPVPTDTSDPVGTVTKTAASREARETCTDMAAKSIQHSGTSEAITFTVPATGEEGAYTLAVRGWTLLTDQDYGLDVTVTTASGGDASDTVIAPTANQAFITTAPHCQLQ